MRTDPQDNNPQAIDSQVIARTQNWIEQFVIAHDLCPFAKRVFDEDKVAYIVAHDDNTELHLRQLAGTLLAMEQEPGNGTEESSATQTCFYIYPDAYNDFEHYLALVEAAETLIEDMGYTDIYQLASFHPQYLFDDTEQDDAANYTNRSPFPMLHILRQQDITLATEHYPDIETVPQRNITLLRRIGSAQLQDILNRLKKA